MQTIIFLDDLYFPEVRGQTSGQRTASKVKEEPDSNPEKCLSWLRPTRRIKSVKRGSERDAPRHRFVRPELFCPHDSFRRDLKGPRENERDRKTNYDQQHDKSHAPVWYFQKWKDLRRDLNQQPRHNCIRDRDLVNIAPLQLGEKFR